jgi:hypothetical protein
MALLQTLVAHPTLWISQEVGHANQSRLCLAGSYSWPVRVPANDFSDGRERHHRKEIDVHRVLGTILVIVLIFLLFRAMSGRRV